MSDFRKKKIRVAFFSFPPMEMNAATGYCIAAGATFGPEMDPTGPVEYTDLPFQEVDGVHEPECIEFTLSYNVDPPLNTRELNAAVSRILAADKAKGVVHTPKSKKVIQEDVRADMLQALPPVVRYVSAVVYPTAGILVVQAASDDVMGRVTRLFPAVSRLMFCSPPEALMKLEDSLNEGADPGEGICIVPWDTMLRFSDDDAVVSMKGTGVGTLAEFKTLLTRFPVVSRVAYVHSSLPLQGAFSPSKHTFAVSSALDRALSYDELLRFSAALSVVAGAQ